MKTMRFLWICLLVWQAAGYAFTQSNILSNGGFEGWISSGDYPRKGENLNDRNPSPWFEFNGNGDVRWYYDSVWVQQHLYQTNPNFQNGHFKTDGFNASKPWDAGWTYDTLFPLPAYEGRYYVGFDSKSDGPSREGVQTKAGPCALNSGNYLISLFYSKTYGDQVEPHIFLSLSDQLDSRRYIFYDFVMPYSTTLPGQWYQHTANFQVDLNNSTEMNNDWFSITGQQLGNSDPSHYVYFDDVRLYRPCDQILECIPTHGQICPSVAILQAPGDLMRVNNISNASDLHLKIYADNGQIIKDTIYHNANGLPDFRFTRLALPFSNAVAYYQYDLEITNACGGFKKTGNIQVYGNAEYNPITPYLDTTANWTGVPIPCCLSSITLQNMQIVGDVSYIVRDEIIVQNGVTMAPNSHVTLQAGNVTELSNVEFDGTNSTLEIVEVPCPNRMACGQGCGGGSMVMDAGEFVIPEQPASESQPTIKNNAAPSESTTFAPLAMETETRLSTYPNPFEKEFQIGLVLPVSMTCTIALQDIQMRTVRTVIQEKEMQAGTHRLAVDLGGMPAGVYVVQLQAGARSYHHRVVKQ